MRLQRGRPSGTPGAPGHRHSLGRRDHHGVLVRGQDLGEVGRDRVFIEEDLLHLQSARGAGRRPSVSGRERHPCLRPTSLHTQLTDLTAASSCGPRILTDCSWLRSCTPAPPEWRGPVAEAPHVSARWEPGPGRRHLSMSIILFIAHPCLQKQALSPCVSSSLLSLFRLCPHTRLLLTECSLLVGQVPAAQAGVAGRPELACCP